MKQDDWGNSEQGVNSAKKKRKRRKKKRRRKGKKEKSNKVPAI